MALKGIRAVFRRGLCKPNDVACIGITNQRETSLLWERQSGKPLGNAIVWQCRRTASFCEGLRKKGLESMVRDRAGLVLDPYFSASKFRWLLNDIEGARGRARRGDIAAGTIDSYLLYRLRGIWSLCLDHGLEGYSRPLAQKPYERVRAHREASLAIDWSF